MNKKDSLKAQESNLEGNYGQRGKAYTWQRNKDEVRQKATEAKERKVCLPRFFRHSSWCWWVWYNDHA